MTDLENIRARIKNTTSDLLWTCYRLKQKVHPKCEMDGALDWVRQQELHGVNPDFRYLTIVSNTLDGMKQRDNESESENAYLRRCSDFQYKQKLNEIGQSLAAILAKIKD